MSKSDINLPKTAFSMKANLPIREPEILNYWQKINLYDELRKSSKGKEKFVLHDGPPYANGNIHMGTALNKILKDIIVKFHQMDGKDSIYVPGWDCHGLPIEWKIEEEYKKNKKNKNDVPIVEFRKECRSFAEKWIEIHKGQFKRLGVVGDWENYYSYFFYILLLFSTRSANHDNPIQAHKLSLYHPFDGILQLCLLKFYLMLSPYEYCHLHMEGHHVRQIFLYLCLTFLIHHKGLFFANNLEFLVL